MVDFSALLDDGIDGNLPKLSSSERARQARARGAMVVAILAALAFVVWIQAGIARFVSAKSESQSAYGAVLIFGAGIALLVFGIALTLILTRADAGRRRSDIGSDRIRKFAEANGLRFETAAESPALPGRIFHGRHRKGLLVTDRVSDSAGTFQIANYGFEHKGGRASTAGGVGYVAIKLDQMLPHLFLEGRPSRERVRSPFAVGIAGEQEISLEGDFHATFTLYAPLDYGADARYLLTPDLMALLVDESGDYTVEIVDDWMFIYSWYPWTDDAEAFKRVFSIIDLVGVKTRRRSSRYSDDKSIESAAVHESGRRLIPGGQSGAHDRVFVVLTLAGALLIGAAAVLGGLVR